MKYSIKDLESLSGIKAHTIRIWEKRYNLFDPQRSDTNIRSYTENDLKKLLNIAQLNNNGIKISRIASMSVNSVEQEVLKLNENTADVETAIKRMVVAVVDVNEVEYERVLSDILMDYDFEVVVTNYLFPFLNRIGVLWQTDSITPAQEHFISNIIRTKLIVATDKLPIPSVYKPQSFLLFLREGELHEIGLLYGNYLLRKLGFKTVYLGQSVPLKDLISIQKQYKANYLVTSLINSNSGQTVDEYLQRLTKSFPAIQIIALGNLLNESVFKSPELKKHLSYTDFRKFLLEI